MKRVVVTLVILIMLAISASIIFYCSIESNKRKLRYPAAVDCSEYQREYKCNPDDMTCQEMKFWRDEARIEFRENRKRQKENEASNYFGSM